MWDILKRICSKVGQNIVYFVLQEILNYPYIDKPKRYNKAVIEIFAKIHFFCKWLKVIMIAWHNFFDTIVIVIILNNLHNDFEIITTTILESRDKIIKEI